MILAQHLLSAALVLRAVVGPFDLRGSGQRHTFGTVERQELELTAGTTKANTLRRVVNEKPVFHASSAAGHPDGALKESGDMAR